jgi:hypothetical protein
MIFTLLLVPGWETDCLGYGSAVSRLAELPASLTNQLIIALRANRSASVSAGVSVGSCSWMQPMSTGHVVTEQALAMSVPCHQRRTVSVTRTP